MAAKPRNVDLGPMYLQVGEEAGAGRWLDPDAKASAGDVSRFEAIMNRGREQPAESAVEALPGPLGPAPAELAQAGEIGAEIEYLWVGTGLASDREVRVGLREALLPDTAVRIHESEGRLFIEFSCGTARVGEWLARKLPVLTQDLGERLSRPVTMAVSMGDGTLAGSRDWPEGA
jgi:hypothetical protein